MGCAFASGKQSWAFLFCDNILAFCNESFHQRIESIQYKAAIAITDAIRGTSSEKLYQELGLESLRSRR